MIDGLLLLAGGAGRRPVRLAARAGRRDLIVPLLTLGFGLPLIKAVGVSLVCVIVTSGAAAGVYLERRVANLRLGMTLELFTAIGALVGGLVAFLLPERVLELLFAGLLVYVAVTMARRRARRNRGRTAPAPTIRTTAPTRPLDAGSPRTRCGCLRSRPLSGPGLPRPPARARASSAASGPASSRRCSGSAAG